VFAKRNIAHVRHVPEKLIDVTMQPLMFVLLFGFVFGGVIAVPSGD
jgi:ABC-2 type transport system permease protein